MATDAGSDSRCGIGARLRAARERSGLSILQAAEKLHADPRVLEALEAERFEELGAAVFVRGHIRRYAELIREQPQELQDLYAHSSHAVARPDLTRVPTTGSRTQDPGKLLVPGLMFVIAIGLIGIVWWFLTSLRTATPPTLANDVDTQGGVITEGPVEAPPDTSAPPASNAVPTRTSKRPAAAAPSRASATPMAPRSAEVATTAQSGGTAATEPVAAPPPAAALEPTVPTEVPDDTVAAAPEETPPPTGGKSSEVTLRFSGDSWAEVYDAKGTKLFYDIGSADSVKTLSGTPPYRVILGNPAGVAIEVNGKSASLPQVAGAENGIQFNLNRSGRISRARAAPSGQ